MIFEVSGVEVGSKNRTKIDPDTQYCSPGTQHGVLEAGLGVLEARLGGLERLLGDYCVLLNGLGRFQNALGTFQEAPKRESLILHWFWDVWVWVRPWTCTGVPWRRVPVQTPKTKFFKDNPRTQGQGNGLG